ncbi:LOW QUALITY PROTEIN: hypothetical protein U0070_013808 [Myodes glareolus]|uniref:Uncharacterized protein n=1 Tax=Myodes glareolus TaxID=447135 RepID=A0AAW0H440_MYOGA
MEVSILLLLGHGVPRFPSGRKTPDPPPGPPPPQVLQMYGHKVGFALDLRPHEDVLYSPELAQRGHDDAVSSISEDLGDPEDMDQDKHDDSTDDSDTTDLMPRLRGMRLGTVMTASDATLRSRTMMLRMVGQETPEEGPEVEEFSEDDDDSEDSEIQAPPMPGLPPLGQTPAPPLGPPGPPPGAPPFPKPPGISGIQGPLPRLLAPGPPPGRPLGPPPGPSPGLPLAPLLEDPHQSRRTSCTSRYPFSSSRPDVPTLGASSPHWAFPASSLAQPGGIECPTQPHSAIRLKADNASAATIEKKATATISAKPHIANPKAEVTRFVPTALRVRRENKGATAVPQRKSEGDCTVPVAKAAPRSGLSVPVSVQAKDDVFEAFRKEMKGCL